jgi:hypothetical protein
VTHRSLLLPGLLAALVVLVAACVPDVTPDAEACAPASVEIDLTLTDEGLDPGAPSVCRDQEVTLRVASDIDGVFHIHGYDSEVPAFEVAASEETEITFTAGRSGQFPIEFHAADDPSGVEVGVFTVHEP